VTDVSVLIVSYRCRDEVLACLDSIPGGTPDSTIEVIVVDNDSRDGTVEAIAEHHPNVTLIAKDTNVGFASGVNRAADEARGDYLLLLNPDTIVHDGAIDRLVAFARSHPEHGLVGGRTVNPDGTTHPGSCWGAPTLWSLFCFATMLSTIFKRSPVFDPESLGRWERDSVREVDIVTGCLLLAPTELWRELGGFDQRFFMYGEDVDLALRARRAGYRPAITPDAVVTHEIGVSSESRPEKFRLVLQGKVTVLDLHWSPLRRRVGRSLLVAGVGTRALAAMVTRRGAGNGSGAGAATWRSLWRERASWLAGFPASPAGLPDDG
jgi:GT2 family glycosyltransferase